MDEFVKLFGVVLAAGGAGAIVYAMVAVAGALSERLRAPAAGSASLLPHVQELEDRVAALQPLADRVLELEERLDFAERLLANPAAARPGAGKEE